MNFDRSNYSYHSTDMSRGFGGFNGPRDSFSNFRGRQWDDSNGDQFGGGGGFHRQRGYGNFDSGLDRMQNFNRGSAREALYPSFGGGNPRNQYGGFDTPHRWEDQYEEEQPISSWPERDGGMNRSGQRPSFSRNPYDRPQFSSGFNSRSTGRFSSNKEGGGPMRGPSFRGRSFGAKSAGFRGKGRARSRNSMQTPVDARNQPKRIEEFVLVEPAQDNSKNNTASNILQCSAGFSKMELDYKYEMLAAGAVRCLCYVQDQKLSEVVSHTKAVSKMEASQQAVDQLRLKCWTILTKQLTDTDGPEITKEEIEDDLAGIMGAGAGEQPSSASMSTPIAAGNLGRKMLEKMGWTGGGIGKDGAGIEEPVTMKQVINREGLGLDAEQDITHDFRSRITELLEQYVASERQDDLVFSPFFRKDERSFIHNTCRRLNLKSKSHGQDKSQSRFLIVRRKRSAFELLNHVMNMGGETSRYKLVPPGMRRNPSEPIVPSESTTPSQI